jgi:protein tyrosine/serine phosphatase
MRKTKRFFLFVVAGALAGCFGPYAGPDQFYPFANFHVVVDGMAYRSAQPDEGLLRDVIGEFGIKTVINLRGENPDQPWWNIERHVCSQLGVTLANIPMSANHLPAPSVLLSLYETLIGAEHPIWIHCMAGSDRTGAASAIWRMSVLQQSREEARSELSLEYGHIAAATPAMDYLVEVFQPDPDWILNEYDPYPLAN